MSVCVEVYRDAGDRPGQAISDGLIASAAVAVARGAAEMNDRAHDRTRVTITFRAPRPEIVVGDLVRVWDPYFPVFTARVVSVRHHSTNEVAWATETVLDRPLVGDTR